MTKNTLSADQFIAENKRPYLEKNRGIITASKLKLLSIDPFSYYEKYEKENPAYAEESTPSLELGSLVDFFANYGEEMFFKYHRILEPRARRDLSSDIVEITNSDGEKLLEIFKELKRQPLFRLGDQSGTRQHKIEGAFSTPFGDVKIGGTPDTIFYDEGRIDDTKTVAVIGREAFENACKNAINNYDYVFSMAFYAVLYYIETGEMPNELTLSFVGTNQVKFLQFSIPQELWQAQVEKIRVLLFFYAECKKDNVWPTAKEILSDDIFAHLHCPFYDINPGAIQDKVIPYFE